jgi:hypothetical protein
MHGSWADPACVLLSAILSLAADGPDLVQIDRKAPKQPSYTSKRPLYGLVVFGPNAQARVWMVLDRSKADAETYDVLYADLDANGDLTEPAERFVGQVEGNNVRFRLPDLKDPATGAVHTNFNARVSGASEPTVMVSLEWRGQRKMGGGYPEDPESGYLRFGSSPKKAPVMWANGDDPFRFQRWYGGRLPLGGEQDFKVFVGQKGAVANSFWAFQEHFLPENEGVQATLVYRDAEDKERRLTCLLKERC